MDKILYGLQLQEDFRFREIEVQVYKEGKYWTSPISSYWVCKVEEVGKIVGSQIYFEEYEEDKIKEFKGKLLEAALKKVDNKIEVLQKEKDLIQAQRWYFK